MKNAKKIINSNLKFDIMKSIMEENYDVQLKLCKLKISYDFNNHKWEQNIPVVSYWKFYDNNLVDYYYSISDKYNVDGITSYINEGEFDYEYHRKHPSEVLINYMVPIDNWNLKFHFTI